MKNLLVAILFCTCCVGVSLAQGNQADRAANERAARTAEREAVRASLREGAARADYNLARERIERETGNAQDAQRDFERAARAGNRGEMQRAIEAIDAADRRAAPAQRELNPARERYERARAEAFGARERAFDARERAGGHREAPQPPERNREPQEPSGRTERADRGRDRDGGRSEGSGSSSKDTRDWQDRVRDAMDRRP